MKDIIVGLGEILWDILPEGKVLGGAPANFAYHTSQFGYDGYAVSAIGDDELGKEIVSTLVEKEGLNYLIETTDYPTGTVQVTLDDAGVPQYEICENVAWDNIPFTEKTRALAQQTKAVSFGSLAQRNNVSKDSVRQFLQAMPTDSMKIFDINLRQHFYTKEIIDDSLQLSDILKINDDEIRIISKLFNIEEKEELDICKYLLDRYQLKLVILTKGTDGSCILTPNETSFLPTPKVQVADTVGAGDAFTAAFITSYLDGEPISIAHQRAIDFSAYVCTQHGAMPKKP